MDYLKLLKSKRQYAVIHKKMPQDIQDYAYHLCWEYNITDPTDKKIRQYILRKLFRSKRYVMINSPFHCDYGFNIHFSGFAFFNYNDSIIDTSPVHIGSHVMVAPNVCISCSGHSVYYKQREQGVMVSKPISIGDDVWIGANSFIMGGVHIGARSVIGAGSTVTRDIPAGVVAFGSPCKVQRKITRKDIITNLDNVKTPEQEWNDTKSDVKHQQFILKRALKRNHIINNQIKVKSKELKNYQRLSKTLVQINQAHYPSNQFKSAVNKAVNAYKKEDSNGTKSKHAKHTK